MKTISAATVLAVPLSLLLWHASCVDERTNGSFRAGPFAFTLVAPLTDELQSTTMIQAINGNTVIACGPHGFSTLQHGRIAGRVGLEEFLGADNPAIDMDFVDLRHGWISALDIILITRDGGHTFSIVMLPAAPNHGIQAVAVERDGGHLFAGGLDVSELDSSPGRSSSGRPFLFESIDGGRTWVRQPLPDTPNDRSVLRIHVLNDRVLLLLENDMLVRLGVGSNWRLSQFTSKCGSERRSSPIQGYLQALWFADESRGWLTADNWQLFRTDSSGDEWCRVSGPQEGGAHFRGVHFADAVNGLGVHDLGALRVSTNGGGTWEHVDSPGRFTQISAVHPGEGWLLGSAGIYSFRARRN